MLHGSDVNRKDEKGVPPICHAVARIENSSLYAVALLLRFGAIITADFQVLLEAKMEYARSQSGMETVKQFDMVLRDKPADAVCVLGGSNWRLSVDLGIEAFDSTARTGQKSPLFVYSGGSESTDALSYIAGAGIPTGLLSVACQANNLVEKVVGALQRLGNCTGTIWIVVPTRDVDQTKLYFRSLKASHGPPSHYLPFAPKVVFLQSGRAESSINSNCISLAENNDLECWQALWSAEDNLQRGINFHHPIPHLDYLCNHHEFRRQLEFVSVESAHFDVSFSKSGTIEPVDISLANLAVEDSETEESDGDDPETRVAQIYETMKVYPPSKNSVLTNQIIASPAQIPSNHGSHFRESKNSDILESDSDIGASSRSPKKTYSISCSSTPERSPRNMGSILTMLGINLNSNERSLGNWDQLTESVVALIQEHTVDLVALAGVAKKRTLDLPSEIARRTGMETIFLPDDSDRSKDGMRTGTAILSMFPILDSRTYKFGPLHGAALAVKVKIEVGRKRLGSLGSFVTIVIVSNHLREQQARELAGFIDSIQWGGPLFLCGDFRFEMAEKESAYRELVRGTILDAERVAFGRLTRQRFTFPAESPKKRYMYWLLRQHDLLSKESVITHNVLASRSPLDHLPVLLEWSLR